MRTKTLQSLTKAAAFVFAFSAFVASASSDGSSYEPIRASGYTGFANKILPLSLEGVSPTLGHFTCSGEMRVASSPRGAIGTGVAVFKTDRGQLVADVAWMPDAKGNGDITFNWKDSVKLSTGQIATSTGVYDQKKPKQGKGRTEEVMYLRVEIIAILIG